MTDSFYAFTPTDAKGKPFPLAQEKGNVVLVVNVASKCGFTPQYKGLEDLYLRYKDKGFTIIGFPCNQFGGQEPGSNDQVQEFCQKNYGVTFPVLGKVDVNGDNEVDVYKWLKSKKSQLLMSRIKWNFEKFLVGRDGQVVSRYASTTSPESIAKDIERELAKPSL